MQIEYDRLEDGLVMYLYENRDNPEQLTWHAVLQKYVRDHSIKRLEEAATFLFENNFVYAEGTKKKDGKKLWRLTDDGEVAAKALLADESE